MFRSAVIGVLAALPLVSSPMSAQQLADPERRSSEERVSVAITGEIGGKTYHASGVGTCRHAPDASIDGASASLWRVELVEPREGEVEDLTFTLWRLKDGSPDRLSLSLKTDSGSHRIQTGGEDEDVGEGSVTILPNGPGGRLEISGKEKRGKTVRLTIDCPAFASVEAEGG